MVSTSVHILTEAAAAGHNDSIESLILEHQPFLHYCIRRLTRRSVSDVEQETVMRLLQRAADGKLNLDSKKELLKLVQMVARGIVIDRHRRRISQCRDVRRNELVDALPTIPNGCHTPSEIVELKEDAERAVSQFTASEVIMVTGRVEGCSCKEIGEKLGVSPNYVSVRISRLKQRMNDKSR